MGKFYGNTDRKHLIGLIQNKHLHRVGLENTALNHVLNTSWSADDNLRPILKSLHIIPDTCTANARMTFNIHEVANGNDDFLDLLSKLTGRCEDQSLASLDVGVKLLQDGDGESCGLSGTRLGLRNDVGPCKDILDIAGNGRYRGMLTLDDRHDSPLLDGRGTFEPIRINTYRLSAFTHIGLLGHAQHYSPRRSSGLRFMESKESVTSS